MTEPTARGRRRRLPKRTLRLFAWLAGTASFLSPLALLGLAPKPTGVATPPAPKVVIRHRTIRRVVWTTAPVSGQPSVRYVYVGGGGGGGGGAAPPVSTGGSHPPP